MTRTKRKTRRLNVPAGVHRGKAAIARRLGIDPVTAWRHHLFEDPRLKTYRIAGVLFATEADILAYIEVVRAEGQ